MSDTYACNTLTPQIKGMPEPIFAECLSMRHIILRGEGCRLSSMQYVYIFIYLFIGLPGSTVVNDSLQSLFIYYASNTTCCLREVVLKGIIGYSFEIVIFESFETNRIFISFNTSHLCGKVICLDVFTA